MFGKQILLRLNGVDKHKTTCGGIATILIFITMFIQIINIFQTLVLRLNPEIVYNQEYVDGVELFSLDSDVFEFAIGMEDAKFQHFIDEGVYYLQAQQIISIRNNQTNQVEYHYQNVTLDRCTKDNFQNPQTQDYFYRQPYTNLYCISRNQTGLQIGGDFDLYYFAYIQINIYRCSGNKCKNISDPDTYQQYFKQPQFAMYFTDALVDPTSYQPIKPIGRDLFFTSSQTLQQQITVFMIKNEVRSQEGIILSNEIVHNGMSFSQYQQQSVITDRDDNLMYQISLRLEKKKQNKWQRKYLTLSQGISQIGGIYQALVALGCLLLFPISQFELNRKLMNQIFSFENSCQEKNNKNAKPISQKIESVIVNKGEIDISKNIAKEARSQVFNNQAFKDLNGTIQLFSQNSIKNQNGNKHHKSYGNLDLMNLKSPKKKTILIQEFLNQAQKEIDEGVKLKDQKLNVLRIDTDQNNKQLNLLEKEYNLNSQYQQQQLTQQQQQVNTSTNNIQSPCSKLIKLKSINNLQIEKPSFQQRSKSPKQILHRSKQKKSQTYFLNNQPPTSSLFAIQKSNLHFNQVVSPNKTKQQIASIMIDQTNRSNSKSNANNTQNRVQSPLSKKEIKQQKKQEKQLKTILKDINKQFQNFFKVTANRIKIKFTEYLRYFICTPKTLQIKKKQMDYGAKKLYHHLDIVYILKKLTEIDKLKMLLLDEQQINLFEYLPRPKIYIEKNQIQENQENLQKFNFLYEDNRTEIERAKDAYESFLELTKQNYDQTQQDKKLLNMIDPHLLELFQQQIIEESEKIINQPDQKEDSVQKFSQKISQNSPNNEHNDFQANSIKPMIDKLIVSQNYQFDTHSTVQAAQNNFKDETVEESSCNQSSNANDSLKENLQQIELKMQQFKQKKFTMRNSYIDI
ncbi:transmembrane protein, putative (macronuclear) [Tetrahymena thermophila SB210]|uniref:Transmembrane protein, putative n=1 Tax=Tetrahymena thermophila (strain SB210) TaxID=312017 RepID=I7MA60_TETTS|nr:transmembrane protein, putative [Tetrahymena thermophila SB210]EAS03774.2 transmembrane protein, putative [Tetrahymena thermophila SB210]|eukprot:XP_001024019.2 transmembrane protein, putative [Tetrahymena thermophila SB210]